MPNVENRPATAGNLVLATIITAALLYCMILFSLVLKANPISGKRQVHEPVCTRYRIVHAGSPEPDAAKLLRKYEKHRKRRLHGRVRRVKHVGKHRIDSRNTPRALERASSRTNAAHRRGRDLVVDEALPGVGVLVKQIGPAQLEGKLRHIHEVIVAANGKLAERKLGTRHEHVGRNADERSPGQSGTSAVTCHAGTPVRRDTVRHQKVNGPRAQAKPHHEVVQLNAAGHAATLKPRRARTVEQLRKERTARADVLKRRYVAQADVHVGRLARPHRWRRETRGKVPHRQTQTLQKSNRICQVWRTIVQSPC